MILGFGRAYHVILSHLPHSCAYLSFYDNVEQVQGEQGIYYTGGFLSFELVHNSMKATQDIIDRYF